MTCINENDFGSAKPKKPTVIAMAEAPRESPKQSPVRKTPKAHIRVKQNQIASSAIRAPRMAFLAMTCINENDFGSAKPKSQPSLRGLERLAKARSNLP
jgi:hypothetical protein